MLIVASGVGKTSLIKSIVQTCGDIVHVDPLSSSLPALDVHGVPNSNRKRGSKRPTHRSISEVYASTRPYPQWWSKAEAGSIFRRKSSGDTVLERNLCFVDTPGYSSGMSKLETINMITQYVEDQFQRSFSTYPDEGDAIGLLSGNGGSQVDVVLYLISDGEPFAKQSELGC